MGIKIFGPSSYEDLIKYWVNMTNKEDSAKCRETKITGQFAKSSRLRCDYYHLTSYSTLVAERRINKYGEVMFLYSPYKYSVTTDKQLRTLTYIKNTDPTKNIIRCSPFDYNFTEEYCTTKAIRRMIHLMMKEMVTYKRARSDRGRGYAEYNFNLIKDDALKLIHFFRATRRTNRWDSVLIKNMSVDENVDKIQEYIDKKTKQERRGEKLREDIENAKSIFSRNGKIHHPSGESVDNLSLSIAIGLTTQSEEMTKIMQKSIGFSGRITIQKEEFYKVKNTIMAVDKVEEILRKS